MPESPKKRSRNPWNYPDRALRARSSQPEGCSHIPMQGAIIIAPNAGIRCNMFRRAVDAAKHNHHSGSSGCAAKPQLRPASGAPKKGEAERIQPPTVLRNYKVLDYLSWQIRHRLLPDMLARRNGVLALVCGSWQEPHCTVLLYSFTVVTPVRSFRPVSLVRSYVMLTG